MKNFTLALKVADRHWTKQQYKAISRWLRVVAGIVDKGMDWEKVDRSMVDAMATGTGVYAPNI